MINIHGQHMHVPADPVGELHSNMLFMGWINRSNEFPIEFELFFPKQDESCFCVQIQSEVHCLPYMLVLVEVCSQLITPKIYTSCF